MKTFIIRIRAALLRLQVRQLVTAAVAGIFLATTLTAASAAAAEEGREADLSPQLEQKLDEITTPGETGRPRTTKQWQEEGEKLDGKPLETVKRVAEESADAVEEMAEVYPHVAKELTPGVEAGELKDEQ